jgi:hypothetical protein
MTPRAILVVLTTAFSLLAARASADDAAIAQKLKDLGAAVTENGGKVTKLSIADTSKLGEADFQAIGQLQGLQDLSVAGHGVNDAALASIGKLANLETLATNAILVSDEGLRHLGNLQNLRSAAFFHTSGPKGFTGVGFGALKACPKLERLTVAGISMGDEAFATIATITQLKEFRTWHTHQTAAAYEQIAKLSNLRSLYLGQRLPHGKGFGPSLTEATIPVLTTMKNLETLTLTEAHFTAGGLGQLKALPHLKKLTISSSDITSAEIEQLRKELPNVTIDYKPMTDEQKTKFEKFLAS